MDIADTYRIGEQEDEEMYLSLAEIESIAAMVLADYYALPRFEGMQVTHIDPVILAYELLGLEIKYHILSRSGSLLGLTAYGDAEVMVYDNDSQPHYERINAKTIFVDKYLRNDPRGSGRLHFTVMHENCHQIYKNLFPGLMKERFRSGESTIAAPSGPGQIGKSGGPTHLPRQS